MRLICGIPDKDNNFSKKKRNEKIYCDTDACGHNNWNSMSADAGKEK